MGLGERIAAGGGGSGRTVRYTPRRSVFAGPKTATSPEYVPPKRPAVFAVIVRVAGVVPLKGVTDNHDPETVLARAVKSAGCPLLVRVTVLELWIGPPPDGCEKTML